MKFHKPLFSIIIIVIQLILSLINHFKHLEFLEKLKKTDPELSGLISFRITYDTLFYFVLVIGFYEMMTLPSWFKSGIRVLLTFIVLGTEFYGLIPIEDSKSVIYNTAWIASGIAVFLILIRIGKYSYGKITNCILKKASS